MEAKEAVEVLKQENATHTPNCDCKFCEAARLAISAIEENGRLTKEVEELRGVVGDNLTVLEENERLREAIKYYFSVLDEVRGTEWRERPDHVCKEFLDALAETEGKEV